MKRLIEIKRQLNEVKHDRGDELVDTDALYGIYDVCYYDLESLAEKLSKKYSSKPRVPAVLVNQNIASCLDSLAKEWIKKYGKAF
jgi:vacuolar-type H+-ATPase subunit F/Vma7